MFRDTVSRESSGVVLGTGGVPQPSDQEAGIMESTIGHLSQAEQQAVLDDLKSIELETRLKAIKRLFTMAEDDRDWFRKFQKKTQIFKVFKSLLQDDSWELNCQCLKFLLDTVTDYVDDLDWFVVTEGMKKHEEQQMEILKEVPKFFHSQLATFDWSFLTDYLTQLLQEVDRGEKDCFALTQSILATLGRLLTFVGQRQFNRYIQMLNAPQRDHYEFMLLKQDDNLHRFYNQDLISKNYGRLCDCDFVSSTENLQAFYGIIPSSVIAQVKDDPNVQIRCAGLQQLRAIIDHFEENDLEVFRTNLCSFLNFLNTILNDLSVRVTVECLSLLKVVIDRLKLDLLIYLPVVSMTIARNFGNQKPIVKKMNLLIVVDLLSIFPPLRVFELFGHFLKHRNSRVREECLNLITAALLKLSEPKEDVLNSILQKICPLLADRKRNVRLSAFESLAVVMHFFGKRNREVLYKCIRECGFHQDLHGRMLRIMAARDLRNPQDGTGILWITIMNAFTPLQKGTSTPNPQVHDRAPLGMKTPVALPRPGAESTITSQPVQHRSKLTDLHTVEPRGMKNQNVCVIFITDHLDAVHDEMATLSLQKKSASEDSIFSRLQNDQWLNPAAGQFSLEKSASVEALTMVPTRFTYPTCSIRSFTKQNQLGKLVNPEKQIKHALKNLSSDEWKDKVDGMKAIQQLLQGSGNLILQNMDAVILALNAEVQNLRSTVSRQAMHCYAEMFHCLKTSMDGDIDKICAVLMSKTGDVTSAFIRNSAMKALEEMVDNATPTKVLNAFLKFGSM
ncbi:unnamed protein product [Soboliphyme baturini]|uniref:TOG domain-containing protein n=1 Tax=Soboliphyme baturini TaxID=241478 RepID=A0A183ILE6_9BILA|nr:unnamed protein product [Soboliphyme baturini]